MATDADTATAAQIQGQAELGSATGPQASEAQIGADAVAAGAGAQEVDVKALLAQLQALQARVETVESERASEKTDSLPSVVQQAQLFYDQLSHRHQALSAGSLLGDVVAQAGDLVDEAKAAVDSGSGDKLLTLAGAISKGLARLANASASADLSYPRQILDEDLPTSAAELKPSAKATPAKAQTFETK
jgi:hypothetical protein